MYWRSGTPTNVGGTGTWMPWHQVYSTANDGNLMALRNTVVSGTNLDTVTATGIYNLGANTNYLNGCGMDWCVLNVFVNPVNYIVQEVTSIGSRAKKFRTRNETSTWSEWIGMPANKAVVKDTQLTSTASTTVATTTAFGATKMFTIKIYLRVTAARTVAIQVNYTSPTGTQARVVLPATLMAVGDTDFIPVTLIANANSAINVVAQTTVANSVYISAAITEEG
ncbi:hypothetical protein D3C75_938210 [compost metagenome]